MPRGNQAEVQESLGSAKQADLQNRRQGQRVYCDQIARNNLTKMNSGDKTLEKSSVTNRLISLVMELSEEQQETLIGELELKLSKERRGNTRKSFPTVVDFASQGRTYREFIQDISESGVFIQASGSFSEGNEITLTFSAVTSQLPDPQKHLRISGRIARVSDTGIGVEFDQESLTDQLFTIRSILKMV